MHTMRMPTFMKQQQEEQTWRKQPTGSIAGSTVLILGLGAIGAKGNISRCFTFPGKFERIALTWMWWCAGESVAGLCSAYGCTVIGTRRNPGYDSVLFLPNSKRSHLLHRVEVVKIPSEYGARFSSADAPPPHCDELHPPDALHALLPRADFVVLATPVSFSSNFLAPSVTNVDDVTENMLVSGNCRHCAAHWCRAAITHEANICVDQRFAWRCVWTQSKPRKQH